LKEINWQRWEEILRPGRGGALSHVQITDCGHPLFQRWITGIEIFIDDLFSFNNKFRTRQRISHGALYRLCIPDIDVPEQLSRQTLLAGAELHNRDLR
jgi:hypothetical protein